MATTQRTTQTFMAIAGMTVTEKKGLFFLPVTKTDGTTVEINCSAGLWNGYEGGEKLKNGGIATKKIGFSKWALSTDEKPVYLAVNVQVSKAGETHVMVKNANGEMEAVVDNYDGLSIVSINKINERVYLDAVSKAELIARETASEQRYAALMQTAITAVQESGGTGADIAALLGNALRR